MQKRTNPLELKVEAKDYAPAAEEKEAVVVTPVRYDESESKEFVPVVEETVVSEPSAEEAEVQQEVAFDETAEEAQAEVEQVASAAADEDSASAAADKKETAEKSETAMAVRFRLAGKTPRRVVLTSVNSEVCRLARALYPDTKMGVIFENALLTRMFLENREAFDAMAREIAKKGGKIKC